MNDERDDTDEDDQDSDDGHSSMLSSISIYRKHQQSPSSLSAFTTTLIRSDGGTTWNRRGTKRHIKVGRTTPSLSSSLACRESIFRVGRGGSIGDTGHHDASRNNHHLPAWITQWFVFAVQSRVGRSLIVVALVTLVFEALIGHILEFLKIVMQTNSGDDMTYLQVIRTITAEKGILGLWDGFCPWGIVQAVCKGAVFGVAHATALQILKPLAEQKYIPMALALTLAGGVGGGFQGYILSPTLLLKTRVMTVRFYSLMRSSLFLKAYLPSFNHCVFFPQMIQNPVFREKMSAWSTTLLSFTIGFDVVKKEGIGALMKGANVFATKRVFDWASRYYFADLFEDLFVQLHNGSSLSVAERSAASLLGGIFSTMVTLPLDVLVAKTQDAKKAGIAVSPLKLFQDELREKGWNGVRNAYMRGFEARLLHVCLTTVGT